MNTETNNAFRIKKEESRHIFFSFLDGESRVLVRYMVWNFPDEHIFCFESFASGLKHSKFNLFEVFTKVF